MGMKEVRVWKYICDKCEAEWFKKNPEEVELPVMCPHCKSKKWNEANEKVKKMFEQTIPLPSPTPEIRLGYTDEKGKVVIERPESIVMINDGNLEAEEVIEPEVVIDDSVEY